MIEYISKVSTYDIVCNTVVAKSVAPQLQQTILGTGFQQYASTAVE